MKYNHKKISIVIAVILMTFISIIGVSTKWGQRIIYQIELTAIISMDHFKNLSEDQEIDFYGKVINQYGKPVVGATIFYEVREYNDWFLFQYLTRSSKTRTHNTNSLKKETDLSGEFHIYNIKGSRLFIKEIKKTDHIEKFENRYFDFYKNNKPISSDDSPIVYTTWHNRTYEQSPTKVKTIRKMVVRTDLRAKIQKRSLIFSSRKIENEFVKDADILVEFINEGLEKIERRERQYNWKVRIIVPGGGIKQTNDVFLLNADSENYSPEIVIEHKKKNPDWRSRVKRKFYVQTGNEKYVSFNLEIDTHKAGDIAIRFKEILFNIPIKRSS